MSSYSSSSSFFEVIFIFSLHCSVFVHFSFLLLRLRLLFLPPLPRVSPSSLSSSSSSCIMEGLTSDKPRPSHPFYTLVNADVACRGGGGGGGSQRHNYKEGGEVTSSVTSSTVELSGEREQHKFCPLPVFNEAAVHFTYENLTAFKTQNSNHCVVTIDNWQSRSPNSFAEVWPLSRKGPATRPASYYPLAWSTSLVNAPDCNTNTRLVTNWLTCNRLLIIKHKVRTQNDSDAIRYNFNFIFNSFSHHKIVSECQNVF